VLERIALMLLWLLHFLPLRALAFLGNSLGRLLYRVGSGRRRVALINLRLCFPELDAAERNRIARRHFQVFARVMLEQGIFWWAGNERFLRLIRIEGVEHWQAARECPIIWLAPHFLGLDMGGVRLSELAPTVSVYSKQKNAVLERMLLKGRSRFNNPELFSRQEGLRGVIKALRRGLPFYYLPDLDFGARDAVFVPFFGVAAATITGLSRIAKLAGARVLPVVTRQLPGGAGYEVRIYPAWENFPSEDLTADAKRMNAFIEARVRETPEQYLWTHKRFKTRPPGEARLY
jgi:Kdo2-lipid IVA lauroyltransferase/acyltransferase